MTTVREIVRGGVRVDPSDTVQAAAVLMRDHGVAALPVCDRQGRLRGVITDRNIVISAVAAGWEPNALTVGPLTHKPPPAVDIEVDISDALNTMKRHRVGQLAVVDNDKFVGMITQDDIVGRLFPGNIGVAAPAVGPPG